MKKPTKINNIVIGAIILFIYLKVFMKFTETLCIVSGTIGLPCPGCGMTRAYNNLLKGNFALALKYHPLVLLPLFILCILIIFRIKKINRNTKKKIIFLILFLVVGVYLIRLVLNFPHCEPMVYNNKALLPRVIKFVLFKII